MKKIVNAAFIYLIAGLAAGVFYREFTKAFAFTGTTTLAFVHPHLLALGVIFLLVLALFCSKFDLVGDKGFKLFWILYNAGMVITAIMLVWRGVLQVLGTAVTPGMGGAISGIAGIGHACLGIGLILAFVILRRSIPDKA